MEFILGFLGAILVLGVLCGGVALGWKLKSYDVAHTRQVTAEKLTEKQAQQVREEMDAWKHLHNYSIEDVYNVPLNPVKAAAKE